MKGIFRVLGGFLLAASPAFGAPFAYVPLSGENKVVVVDLATDKIVDKIAVGSSPQAVAFSPSGSRFYVANVGDGTLTTIVTGNDHVAATTPVGAGPLGVAVSSLGQVAVATAGGSVNGGANTISILGPGIVNAVAVGSFPVAVAYNPAGDKLYVANADDASLSVVDTTRLLAVDTIHVDANPTGLVMDPSGKRLYVLHQQSGSFGNNQISVVDLTGIAHVSAVTQLLGTPQWMDLSPTGALIAVAKPSFSSVSIVDTVSAKVLFDIQLTRAPTGVSWSPDGKRLYVLLNATGTGSMAVFDTSNWQQVDSVDVGSSPMARGTFVQPSPPGVSPGPLSGLWWNPAESGWGVHFTQRSGNILATWFTYDANGKATWYAVPNCAIGSGNSCSGTVYQVTGPRFFAVPQYDPSLRNTASVGSASFDFSDNDHASMSYSVNGKSRTVAIQREMFDTNLTFPNLWGTINYTDMWWNPDEPGWGLALTQQLGTVVAIWYVYDANGQPDWFIAPNCMLDPDTATACGGQIYHTTGPVFGTSFDPTAVKSEVAGYLKIDWTDGSHATIDGIAYGSSSHKTITRELF